MKGEYEAAKEFWNTIKNALIFDPLIYKIYNKWSLDLITGWSSGGSREWTQMPHGTPGKEKGDQHI